MADAGPSAGGARIVAVCPNRQPTILLIAQAIGLAAMLVVLALIAIAFVATAILGRAYDRLVEDVKGAGHLAVETAGRLAQSPYAAEVLAAGRGARTAVRRSEQAAASLREGGAKYSRASECYRWLAARQGELMRGDRGPPLALCPAGEAAVGDAQAGASGACPQEPGPPPRPQHEVYRAFLDAQCPWQRVWGALRPQGGHAGFRAA